MLTRKPKYWSVIVLVILPMTSIISIFALPNQRVFKKIRDKGLDNMAIKSKAEIINELTAIKEDIGRLEKRTGKTGTAGVKVYSADETVALLDSYKALRRGLDYLNHGSIKNINDWEGYRLLGVSHNSFGKKETFQVLNELKEANLPSGFLADFRVYLLPFRIPEISGLGGAGFALISAPEISEKSIEQLRITLLHELGHHIHSQFMPTPLGRPSPLWDKYLVIRGGEWHGAGGVNTTAWNNSSEETFAEDFRLLFGKDQFYYGDIALGDPRVNPKTTAELKQFILELDNIKITRSAKSPWIPDGLEFWIYCPYFILFGWIFILAGVIIISQKDCIIRGINLKVLLRLAS